MSELIASVKHHVLVNPERYTHCVIKDMKEKYPELETQTWARCGTAVQGHQQAAGCLVTILPSFVWSKEGECFLSARCCMYTD